MKLFDLGRLTSGQAAEMAGLSRVEFLLTCRKYGSSSVQWDQEDLDAEFAGDSF
jgi:predicted HTH domain antitoxin